MISISRIRTRYPLFTPRYFSDSPNKKEPACFCYMNCTVVINYYHDGIIILLVGGKAITVTVISYSYSTDWDRDNEIETKHLLDWTKLLAVIVIVFLQLLPLTTALKGKFDWEKPVLRTRVEWRSVWMGFGEQCVQTIAPLWTLTLFVNNLDSRSMVTQSYTMSCVSQGKTQHEKL